MSSGLWRKLVSALWFGVLTTVAMGPVHALWSDERLHRWTFVAILLAAGYYGGMLGSRMVAPRSNHTQRDAVVSGLFIATLSVATGLLVELIARGHRLDLGSLIVLIWTLPLLLLVDYWPMLLFCMLGGAVLYWLGRRFN